MASRPEDLVTTESENELITQLNDIGLEGPYWADILNQKGGISKLAQIPFIEANDLKKIESSLRHAWELKALRRFLKISDESYKALTDADQSKQLKQTCDVNQKLEDMTKLSKSQKGLSC